MKFDKLNFTNVVDGTATILLYKHFGDLDGVMGINGDNVANEIQAINEFYSNSINNIKVRINSIGGSVQHGLSICAAIQNSTIPCDTYIDGMAYSMAGVVAMCGRKKYMVDYGTFMMHNANGGSDENVLELITNSLAKIFENNTALTMDKCKELMARETWLNATECVNMGLIDEMVSTGKNSAELMNSMQELQNRYNEIINKVEIKSEIKMNKLTELLNLSNDASEEIIVASVQEKEAKIAELQTEIENAKAELSTFKKEKEEKESAEKAEVIENLVKEGKIDAATKEIFVNSGKTANELKELGKSLKPAYTPVFTNTAQPTLYAGREKWTFNDWSKQDPKGLKDLQANDPTTFENLVKGLPSELSNNYNPETDKRF